MKKKPILGITVGVFFAIALIAISTMPTAIAKPYGNGQSDLVATLAADDHNDGQGHA